MNKLFTNAGAFRLRFSFRLYATMTLALIVVVVGFAGCGYHRVGSGDNVPDGVNSIAVPVFRNDSYEAGIEVLLTDAFKEQIVRSGFVRLTNVKNADAVVIGTIRKYSVKAISFSTGDFASEYRVTLSMRMKLVAKNGDLLWEDPGVSRIEEYRVSADIFASESARKRASDKIAIKMMADVHDRIFDGFKIDPDTLRVK